MVILKLTPKLHDRMRRAHFLRRTHVVRLQKRLTLLTSPARIDAEHRHPSAKIGGK
jgi:hypothetical protein